jgi:hypothetical protein
MLFVGVAVLYYLLLDHMNKEYSKEKFLISIYALVFKRLLKRLYGSYEEIGEEILLELKIP